MGIVWADLEAHPNPLAQKTKGVVGRSSSSLTMTMEFLDIGSSTGTRPGDAQLQVESGPTNSNRTLAAAAIATSSLTVFIPCAWNLTAFLKNWKIKSIQPGGEDRYTLESSRKTRQMPRLPTHEDLKSKGELWYSRANQRVNSPIVYDGGGGGGGGGCTLYI